MLPPGRPGAATAELGDLQADARDDPASFLWREDAISIHVVDDLFAGGAGGVCSYRPMSEIIAINNRVAGSGLRTTHLCGPSLPRGSSAPFLAPIADGGVEQEDLPMSTDRALFRCIVVLVLPLLLAACSSMRTIQVALPPRVDLAAYPTVGLITFSTTNGDVGLGQRCTQRFLAAVQEAQPGTRVVELGSEADVLNEVRRSALDHEALRAIQSSRGVAAVLTGRLEVGKTKPQVNVSASWISQVNVRADIDVALTARLIETANAATVWTDGGRRTENVANAGVSQNGKQGTFGFEMHNPDEAYDGIIDSLVCEITDAFRTHYVKRRVPKEEAAAP